MTFLSVRQKSMQKEAWRHKVIDKCTGEEIKRVIWANDDTGRYRQYLADVNGKLVINKAGDAIESKIFNGNIKIVRRPE